MPTMSADGNFVYYAEPDSNEHFQLFRIKSTGGETENISPKSWNWGEPTTRVSLKQIRQRDWSLQAMDIPFCRKQVLPDLTDRTDKFIFTRPAQ